MTAAADAPREVLTWEPVMLPPVPAAVDLAGARVLLVDDVADTGETLRLVRE